MTRFVNNVKTTLLLGAIMGLALAVGSIFGTRGLIVGFVFGGAVNLIAYFFSAKIALMSMHAREVSPEEAPELHGIVDELSQRAGIPKPRVYVSPAEAPNAFATGRSPRNAAVCVTEGLLQVLSRNELGGVLGHELAHIKHYDILISSVAATVAGAISALAHMAFFLPIGSRDDNGGGGNPLVALLLLIFAPIAAMVIQMAISRSREYAADNRGAEIHGNPLDLAQALIKLDNYARRIPLQVSQTQSNMFIVQPFSGQSLASLFSTHPPTGKRVEKLYEQAGVRQ
jgi:heat shock protein HtpX